MMEEESLGFKLISNIGQVHIIIVIIIALTIKDTNLILLVVGSFCNVLFIYPFIFKYLQDKIDDGTKNKVNRFNRRKKRKRI